jgi:pilus assembly protein Flp/PilA
MDKTPVLAICLNVSQQLISRLRIADGLGGVSRRSYTMKTVFKRFVKDQSAATAIEYGLIAAGIAVAIIAVVAGLGTSLNTTFSTVQTALK